MERLHNCDRLIRCDEAPISSSQKLSFYQFIREDGKKLDVYIGVNENTNHIVFVANDNYWTDTFDTHKAMEKKSEEYLHLLRSDYLHYTESGPNWVLAGAYNQELCVLTENGSVKHIPRDEYKPGILSSYSGSIDWGPLKFAFEEEIGGVTLGYEFIFENGIILIELSQDDKRKNSVTPFIRDDSYLDHIENILEFKNIDPLYTSEDVSRFLVKETV